MVDHLSHRWQTQGRGRNPALHLVLSGPAPCFYLAAAPSSLYPLRSSYIYTVLNYIRPFEGNCEADVATGENDFDTPKSFIKPNNYAEVVNVATRKIQFY